MYFHNFTIISPEKRVQYFGRDVMISDICDDFSLYLWWDISDITPTVTGPSTSSVISVMITDICNYICDEISVISVMRYQWCDNCDICDEIPVIFVMRYQWYLWWDICDEISVISVMRYQWYLWWDISDIRWDISDIRSTMEVLTWAWQTEPACWWRRWRTWWRRRRP